MKQLILFMVLVVVSLAGSAQQDPTDTIPNDPGAMVVYKVQDMNFGAFTSGNGGSIALTNAGLKSTTGGVIAMNTIPTHPAIFEIDAPWGVWVTVMMGAPITMSNGSGGTMTLTLNPENNLRVNGVDGINFMFQTDVYQPARTTLEVGGTLAVPSGAPPGNYTGTFEVIFFQD